MTTLLSRLREIMRAQQHAALDALENPHLMSTQLLRETESDLATVRKAMLGTAIRLKQITRHRQQLESAIDQCQAQASAALRQGQEDEAREQLALKLNQQQELQQTQALHDQLESTMSALRQERQDLKKDRADMSGQMRLLKLQQATFQPGDGLDRLYQERLRRRERMADYARHTDSNLDALQCAQALRAEEAPRQAAHPTAVTLEAELSALKAQIHNEGAPA